jgi:hypothetical protein
VDDVSATETAACRKAIVFEDDASHWLDESACAGPSRSHKTAHRDHRFRRMPIGQNGASRSPIPAHADRTKRRIAIS